MARRLSTVPAFARTPLSFHGISAVHRSSPGERTPSIVSRRIRGREVFSPRAMGPWLVRSCRQCEELVHGGNIRPGGYRRMVSGATGVPTCLLNGATSRELATCATAAERPGRVIFQRAAGIVRTTPSGLPSDCLSPSRGANVPACAGVLWHRPGVFRPTATRCLAQALFLGTAPLRSPLRAGTHRTELAILRSPRSARISVTQVFIIGAVPA